MKRFLIIILILSILGASGYYVYNMKFSKELEIGYLIPENTVFAYTTNDIQKDYSSFSKLGLYQKLSQFSWFLEFQKKIKIINSGLLDEKVALSLSFHKINQSEVDVIYYLDGNNGENMKKLFNFRVKKDSLKLETRSLDGYKIMEVLSNNKLVFSYVEIDNWYVASRSSFLIEKVIKNRDQKFNYYPENGILEIFGKNLKSYLTIYFNENEIQNISPMLDKNFKLKLFNNEDAYLLKGISDSKIDNTGQKVRYMNIREVDNYLPMSTSFIIQEGVFLKGILNDFSEPFWICNKTIELGEVQDTIFGIDNHLIFDVKESIQEIDITNLKAVKLDSKLIISESVELLEKIIKDFDNENVWDKSLKVQNGLSNMIEETSWSFILNWSAAKSYLNDNVNEEYSKEVNLLLDWVKFISLQFTNTKEEVILESFITIDKDVSNKVTKLKNNSMIKSENGELIFEHSNEIITKPFVVKNHNNGTREIIFQDVENNIRLMGTNRKLLWKIPLKSSILSNIYQIDIFRNRKLQYVFCTENELVAIDRNGNMVENFPVVVGNKIDKFSILDYDNNRNYRLVTTSLTGEVTLYNIKGEILDPWNKKDFKNRMVQKVDHYKIGAKDYFILVTNDKKIHITNRKGEYIDGFPLKLTLNNVIGYVVEKGASESKSKIKVYSGDGQISIVNLKGEILQESLKLNKEIDKAFIQGNNKAKVISGVKGTKVKISNSIDENIFEINYLPDYAYVYYFSNTKKLITVGILDDREVYTTDGKLITKYNSTLPESCLYSESKEELIIYKVNTNKIEKVITQY